MAIKGYISSTTYTAIENTIYEKSLKRCTALLTIYKDETKKKILANRSVSVDGLHEIPCLISLSPVDNVPENIENKFFLISETAQDRLVGLEGRLAKVAENGDIQSFVLQNDIFLMYVEDEESYRIYENGIWAEKLDVTADSRIWNKWFAPEIAMEGNTNPTQQMYKFMKTLLEFKDCEDV